jgi:hypothetical protein
MNPLSARLYGLPKLHKKDVPIRPVVSYVGTPALKLAFKLNTIFCKFTHYFTKHCIKNSFMLTSELQNMILPPNAKLISFSAQFVTSINHWGTISVNGNVCGIKVLPFQWALLQTEWRTGYGSSTPTNYSRSFYGSSIGKNIQL